MNICVFSLITARHGQIGGMKTHGDYLWHGLAVRGPSVHLVSTRHPVGVIDEEIDGVKYHYLPNVSTGSSGGLWRRYSGDKLREKVYWTRRDGPPNYPLKGSGRQNISTTKKG